MAVEPSEANLALLRRNVAEMDVLVIAGAVWDRPATLQIANEGAGMTAFRMVETDGTGRAESGTAGLTIDRLIAAGGHGRCLLVKLDIEGAETSLFRSNTGWLDCTDAVVVELHDWLYPWSGSSRTLLREVAARRFDVLVRGENLVCFRHPVAANASPAP